MRRIPDGRDMASDLGMILVTQKATHAMAITSLVLGILLLPMALALAFITRPGADAVPPAQRAVAVSLAGLALLPIAFGAYVLWRDWGMALYLHERGIRVRRGGRMTTLTFDEAAAVAYQATDVYAQGVYVGTAERFEVRADGSGQRWLPFRRRRPEAADPESDEAGPNALAEVADQVARMIAGTWAERLQDGETVTWTPRFRLHRTGLDLARPPWWERDLGSLLRPGDKWTRVRWKDIAKTQLEKGRFSIWLNGESKPHTQTSAGALNFHPGLLVFEQLRKHGAAGLEGMAPKKTRGKKR